MITASKIYALASSKATSGWVIGCRTGLRQTLFVLKHGRLRGELTISLEVLHTSGSCLLLSIPAHHIADGQGDITNAENRYDDNESNCRGTRFPAIVCISECTDKDLGG